MYGLHSMLREYAKRFLVKYTVQVDLV